MTANAIGLLIRDVSGPHLLRDQRVITDVARKHGYTLTEFVTIAHDTFMPTTLVITTAYRKSAQAIIAPSIEHFNHRSRALALVCDLITPTHLIACASADRRASLSARPDRS
jgi:hypothetical protein